MKFSLIKKKDPLYLYLEPTLEGQASYALLDREELERRLSANEISEEGRLFEIERELTIRTEKTTFID